MDAGEEKPQPINQESMKFHFYTPSYYSNIRWTISPSGWSRNGTEEDMMKKKSSEQKAGWIVREPAELLKFLFEMMPSQSRKSVKGMLGRGQVTVNDNVITQFKETLSTGDRVAILSEGANPKVKVKGIEILYEDDDLVAVDKEAGLLTIASDKEKQATAYRQLSDYVKSGNPK